MSTTENWARRVLLSRVRHGGETVDELVAAIRRVANDLDEDDPLDPARLWVDPQTGNILYVPGIPGPGFIPYRGDEA